jgi:nicotinamidase-related amidase
MFDRAGRNISLVQTAVPPTALVLAASRRAGLPIIYLKMAFKPDLTDMGPRHSPKWRDHFADGVGNDDTNAVRRAESHRHSGYGNRQGRNAFADMRDCDCFIGIGAPHGQTVGQSFTPS